jgi:hypothetical protein
LTAAEFKALFPEFANAPDALVESRIAWAVPRTPVDVWGADYLEQGIGLLAAHFLSLAPNAKAMRKGERPGETMYLAERTRIARIVGSAAAHRVAGLPSTPLNTTALTPSAVPEGWPPVET